MNVDWSLNIPAIVGGCFWQLLLQSADFTWPHSIGVLKLNNVLLLAINKLSPQVENLQAYKFEHLYQQVADIALSTLLPKAAESKTGLGHLKNKETQQAAEMNQSKNGSVGDELKIEPVKSWPQLDNSKLKTELW